MTRVGIDSQQEMLDIIAMPGLDCKAAYTHFAAADSLDPSDVEYTDRQSVPVLYCTVITLTIRLKCRLI